VVVVTHNRPEDLKECLESLKRQKHPRNSYEVLVVDSSTTYKNETKMLVQIYPAKYIHTKYKGMTLARNIGICKAKGEIIAFLDDDAIADENWIKQILKNYNDSRVGGVGGQVIEDRPVRSKKRTHAVIGKIDKSGELISNFDLGEERIEVDHIKGTNMSFLKKHLIEMDGFDNLYGGRAYREETDVCMRLKKRGHLIIYTPKAKVFHKRIGPKTSHAIRGNIILDYWRARNHSYFYFKNIFASRILHFIGFLKNNGNMILSRARERLSFLASIYYLLGLTEGALLAFLTRPYRLLRNLNCEKKP
jgi:glycosyltransferase involved in cell wall biosynthesis